MIKLHRKLNPQDFNLYTYVLNYKKRSPKYACSNKLQLYFSSKIVFVFVSLLSFLINAQKHDRALFFVMLINLTYFGQNWSNYPFRIIHKMNNYVCIPLFCILSLFSPKTFIFCIVFHPERFCVCTLISVRLWNFKDGGF